MKYRPDIDGLRGVGVLAVLLFHAKVPAMSGGFAGVDVFFVISGFLITSQIKSSLADGRFSYLDFFERRVRRLFPALFMVVSISTGAGYVLLMPQDLKFLGMSQIYTALFASNVLFWKISFKYFSEGALFPLLHTWSLGVEEQFYLVAPFALVGFFRARGRAISFWLLGTALLSVAAFSALTLKGSPGAFYLAPLRAWEFLCGSLVAIAPPARLRTVGANRTLEIAGMLFIIVGVTRQVSGPVGVLFAVIPAVLGTAMLIWLGGGRDSVMTPVLSFPPLRGVGMISYSLYLWHWPLLIFLAAYLSRNPTVQEGLFVVGLSVPLAYLSWRFVERPFRGPGGPFPSSSIRQMAEISTLIILLSGYVLRATSGFPGRMPRDLAAFMHDDAGSRGFATPEDVHAMTFPIIGRPSSASPRIFMWGDSHAEAARPALELLAQKTGEPVMLAAWSACPPVLTGRETSSAFIASPECRRFNEAAVTRISRSKMQEVILAAHWSTYEPESPQFIADFRATVGHLVKGGSRVWILIDNPLLPFHPARRAFRLKSWVGQENLFRFSRAQHDKQGVAFRQVANGVEDGVKVRLLDPTGVYCDEALCHSILDGKLLFRDPHHVSRVGSVRMAPVLESAFTAHRANL